MADCKWCKDEFCVNDDCPMRADYCPVPDIEGVCKYEERLTVDEGKTLVECARPCPHCGGTNLVFLYAEGSEIDVTVCCNFNNGGCGATGGYRRTKEEAIEAWNRRTENGQEP